MLAANGIYMSVNGLTLMPSLGVAIAGAIRLGNCLGAHDVERAELVVRVIFICILAITISLTVLLYIIHNVYAKMYTNDPVAIR